jgi:hypothetical protein
MFMGFCWLPAQPTSMSKAVQKVLVAVPNPCFPACP